MGNEQAIAIRLIINKQLTDSINGLLSIGVNKWLIIVANNDQLMVHEWLMSS